MKNQKQVKNKITKPRSAAPSRNRGIARVQKKPSRLPIGFVADYHPNADKKSFGIQLEGSSMEPTIRSGDIVVVHPSVGAAVGDVVIANVMNRGLVGGVLRTSRPPFVTISPTNERRPRMTFLAGQLHWLYRVSQITRLEPAEAARMSRIQALGYTNA
jgi:hypothetical protein